jgi:hypothetical protein
MKMASGLVPRISDGVKGDANAKNKVLLEYKTYLSKLQ